MTGWDEFERGTPEERAQRQAVLDGIAAAEGAALAAIRQIGVAVEQHPGIAELSGSGALRKIATVAGATANSLGKRAFDRDELRRQKRQVQR